MATLLPQQWQEPVHLVEIQHQVEIHPLGDDPLRLEWRTAIRSSAPP
jgi:hypothetical protein